jgi:hypothetical protein
MATAGYYEVTRFPRSGQNDAIYLSAPLVYRHLSRRRWQFSIPRAWGMPVN